MGQWGRVTKYDGITIIPHVNTGKNPFNPIRPGSFIDRIFVLDSEGDGSDRIHEEYAMEKKFVGMPYTEYLRITHWTCPTCNQPIRKCCDNDKSMLTL
jgi:hypothetical protein